MPQVSSKIICPYHMMSRNPRYPCIQIIATRGTHFDVGYNIGCTFQPNIRQFYQQSSDVQNKLEPFYHQHGGRDIYQTYLRTVQDQFPQYINEMKGTAEGAGMAFEKIFLLNISNEVYNYHWAKMNTKAKVEEGAGCSDIMINRPGAKYLVHNEDLDPLVKPYGYLVKADISDAEIDSNESFTAYSLPGFLPGRKFGFNKHGLVFGLNALYPESVNVHGTPRIVVNRHMMSFMDINDASEKLTNKGYGCASGFNLNLASFKDPENMWAIEVGPGDGKSKLHLQTIPEQTNEDEPWHYVHVNNYKHLNIKEDGLLDSTVARGKRLSELEPPKTLTDALNVLGDTHNKHYPIYRTTGEYDTSATVVTAAFKILEKKSTCIWRIQHWQRTHFCPCPCLCNFRAEVLRIQS